MPNNFWKANERQIAREFGTERIGANRGVNTPDFENEWLVGEIFTHDVPDYMISELVQAEKGAKGEKLAIGIMHEKGKRLDDAIVFMRLKDFKAHFGS